MQQVKQKFNCNHQSLVPGCPAFDARYAHGSHIVKILAYVTKSPRNSYALYNPDFVKFDESTGEIEDVYRQRKKRLRPGQAAKLALQMKDFTLDSLLCGGGEGVAILNELKTRMLKQYHQELTRKPR